MVVVKLTPSVTYRQAVYGEGMHQSDALRVYSLLQICQEPDSHLAGHIDALEGFELMALEVVGLDYLCHAWCDQRQCF